MRTYEIDNAKPNIEINITIRDLCGSLFFSGINGPSIGIKR